MRKLLLAIVVVMFGVTQVGSAQTAPAPKDRKTRRAAKAPKPKPDLRRVLRARVTQVEWDDAPFNEVIEWLRERGEINVVVRWNVLLEQGIDEDSPVSLRLKDARVATILSETLAQLSHGEELRYIGIGPTLTISTREDLNKKLYVKVYPVNDLLFRVPEFTEAPKVSLEQGGGGGGPGGGSASQNPFQGGGGGGGGDEDTRPKSERLDELVQLIKETVEPESWRDNGGEGTIRGLNSVIVVRATLDVHVKLGGSFVID